MAFGAKSSHLTTIPGVDVIRNHKNNNNNNNLGNGKKMIFGLWPVGSWKGVNDEVWRGGDDEGRERCTW